MDHSCDAYLWDQIMRKPRPWKAEMRLAHRLGGKQRQERLHQIEKQRKAEFAAGWRALETLVKT